MTESSWDSEFALDAETVRQLVRTQFPGLAATSVAYMHEGWDSVAFVVDGEWVFRFPKRRERQEWLDSEIAVLSLLAERRLPIAVPFPAHLGRVGPLFPCG